MYSLHVPILLDPSLEYANGTQTKVLLQAIAKWPKESVPGYKFPKNTHGLGKQRRA